MTDTHKGTGYNEMRFEDESGHEEIFVHAQRDLNVVTRRDHLTSVDRSRFVDVGGEQMSRVSGNMVSEVGGTIEMASAMGTVISTGVVGHSKTPHRPIPQSTPGFFERAKARLKAMNSALRSGGLTLRAQTFLVEEVGMSKTSLVGAASQEIVGGTKSVRVGSSIQITSGESMLFATADNTAIEAGDRIDIVCGESSIRLKASGEIELKGKGIRMIADKIDMN